MAEEKYQPEPTVDSQPYWDGVRRHQLLYQRCRACNQIQFPFKARCSGCLSPELEHLESGGRGTVYTFTTIWRAPSPAYAREVPYSVALVDLDEGFRMLAGLTDIAPEEVEIGLRVTLTTARADDELSVPMFSPLEAPARRPHEPPGLQAGQ
jgi:uncharacterized OB-fold protein